MPGVSVEQRSLLSRIARAARDGRGLRLSDAGCDDMRILLDQGLARWRRRPARGLVFPALTGDGRRELADAASADRRLARGQRNDEGFLYRLTRDADLKVVASLVRAHLRDFVAKGLIDDFKISVRCDFFAGGQAIDLASRIKPVWTDDDPDVAKWRMAYHCASAILEAYNRDNGNVMVDYSSLRFFGGFSASWPTIGRGGRLPTIGEILAKVYGSPDAAASVVSDRLATISLKTVARPGNNP